MSSALWDEAMRAFTTLLMLTSTLCGAGSVLAQTANSTTVPAASTAHPELWPKASSPAAMSDPATEAFVADLLTRMTIEEKVGQIIQADIASITPADLAVYPLGSILAGGNSAPGGDDRASAQAWVDLARAFRAAAAARPGARIPLIYGIDAVHGHNNVVGATIFPHNIGLGAARDPDLIRRIGEATALEVAATGADWTFGPTLAVPRDDRWGRSYEGYAETPEVQRAYAGPMTLGLQGELSADHPLEPGHIAGSAKHFLADGGTHDGKDQSDFQGSEQELIDIHLGGYPAAIDAVCCRLWPASQAGTGLNIRATNYPARRLARSARLRRLRGLRLERSRPAPRLLERKLRPGRQLRDRHADGARQLEAAVRQHTGAGSLGRNFRRRVSTRP
jgi:beta-glucosidase